MRELIVSLDEFKHELKINSRLGRDIFNKRYEKGALFGHTRIYLWKTESFWNMAYYPAGKKSRAVIIKTKLDGKSENTGNDILSGHVLFGKHIGKYIPKIHDKGEGKVNTSGIIYTKEGIKEGEIYKVFTYDINSAWPYFLAYGQLPDTSEKDNLGAGPIKKGECGFRLKHSSKNSLTSNLSVMDYEFTTEIGDFCEYRFKIWDSFNNDRMKLTENILKYYDLKKNAKTKREKNKYKSLLNHGIGMLQNSNSFIRVAVISQGNQFIRNIIQKYRNDVIYSNTDSIKSLVRIPELDKIIGDKLGEVHFKEEILGFEKTLSSNSFNQLILDQNNIIIDGAKRGKSKFYYVGQNYYEFLKNKKYNDVDLNLKFKDKMGVLDIDYEN